MFLQASLSMDHFTWWLTGLPEEEILLLELYICANMRNWQAEWGIMGAQCSGNKASICE